jgi:hypothetical protein
MMADPDGGEKREMLDAGWVRVAVLDGRAGFWLVKKRTAVVRR